MPISFCLAEDRPAEDTAIRLVLLSLREHDSDVPVYLFRPDPTASLIDWLREFPSVTLIPSLPTRASGWNCKPHVLLNVLERGHDNVVWLDSDILVTSSCERLFRQSKETVVVAKESTCIPDQGTAIRTVGWNLPVGRSFPRTINSCVMRVTPAHRTLLLRWAEMLRNPEYLAAQNSASYNRPPHLGGDQDALNALLGSTEFSNLPVHELDEKDVIHTGGARTFPLRSRVAGLLRRMPAFVHSSGPKPWIVLDTRNSRLVGRFWTLQRLILEVSPYTAVARKYEQSLGADTSWMRYSSPLGRLLRLIGLGHYSVRGMPLVLAATAAAALKKLPHPKPAVE